MFGLNCLDITSLNLTVSLTKKFFPFRSVDFVTMSKQIITTYNGTEEMEVGLL
jgi:hypothetical protein